MDMPNQRYTQTMHMNQHPGLTFNGFKSLNNNNGLSLESMINKVYFSQNNDDLILTRSLFNEIANTANLSLIENPITLNGCGLDKPRVDVNSRMLQNLAFVALVSYVASEEGIYVVDPPSGLSPLPPPSQAMNNLKLAFDRLLSYGVFGMSCNDEVHRVGSITNIARAVDLYLALENAYKYY
jgi:hypothetical protein